MSSRRHNYSRLKSSHKRLHKPSSSSRDTSSKRRKGLVQEAPASPAVKPKRNSQGDIISTKKVNLFLKGSQQPSKYDVQRRKQKKKLATQEEETKKVLEEFQRIHAKPGEIEDKEQRKARIWNPTAAPTPGKKRKYEPSFLPGATKRAKLGGVSNEEKRLTERDKARMRKDIRRQQKDGKREGLESLRKEIEAKRQARKVVGSLGLLGDPTKQTTNIYVSNLPKHIGEDDLREVFKAYGPISSVKVMWPRTEKELQRDSHHGFVNFVRRQDAENALAKLTNALVWGVKLRFGWGEALHRNEPPAMGIMPPMSKSSRRVRVDESVDKTNVWPHAVPKPPMEKGKIVVPPGHPKVQVKIPSESRLKQVIDKTAAFVTDYGMEFEYLLLERSRDRRSSSFDRFRFLFAIDTEEHMYYRWKLWSLANRDTMKQWSDQPFQMLENGPFWIPPPCPSASESSRDRKRSDSRHEDKKSSGKMFRPTSRFDRPASSNIVYKNSGDPLPPTKAAVYGGRVSKPLTARPLSQDNRQMFVAMLRQIKPTRKTIRSAMKFCLDNAEMATEVAEILSEALTTSNKNTEKKLARLYLLHDILRNSSSMVKNASAYPAEFKKSLPEIVETLFELSNSLQSAKKTIFDKKVLKLYDLWDKNNLFTRPFISRLRNAFLGRKEDEGNFKVLVKPAAAAPTEDDMDGEPMSDIDGESISGGE